MISTHDWAINVNLDLAPIQK